MYKNRIIDNRILIFTSYGGEINPITFVSFSKHINKVFYIYKYNLDLNMWENLGDITKVDKNKYLNSIYTFVSTKEIPEKIIKGVDNNFRKKIKDKDIDAIDDFVEYFIYKEIFTKKFYDFIENASEDELIIGVKLVKLKKGDKFRINEYDGSESIEFFNEDNWYTHN